MDGKKYLKHGDVAKLAIKLNVEANHVSKVLNGRVKNERIYEALEKLIKKREQEMEMLIQDFD